MAVLRHAGFFVWLPLHHQVQWHRTLILPTGKVAFRDVGSYQLMQWLQARTQPGESFFNDDAVEFYLKLKNPTHVEFVNNDAFTSPQDVARIIAAMQRTARGTSRCYPAFRRHLRLSRRTVPFLRALEMPCEYVSGV